MLIRDLRNVILSDVKVIQERPQAFGTAKYIFFEGELNHKDVDPEVLDKEVESISASSLGKIRIIIKEKLK